MARYIDADKLKTRIAPESYFRHTLVEWVDLQETEDVAPVIHAHWERHFKRPGVYEDLCWHCTNCNSRTLEEYAPYWWLYCPYCGAKMDEEVE